MIKWIITGTGRCGTVFLARVLTELGVPCGHESIFNEEKASLVMDRFRGYSSPVVSKCSDNQGWVDLQKIVADSSYMAVPYLECDEVKKIPILHIVRNPFDVISSFVKDLKYFSNVENNVFNEKGWEQWICSKMPEFATATNSVERACCYYVGWNTRIEKSQETRPYLLHRIEDDFEDDFFDFFNIPRQPILFRNKRINTMKVKGMRENFRVEDIPEGPIKKVFLAMGKKYNYLS